MKFPFADVQAIHEKGQKQKDRKKKDFREGVFRKTGWKKNATQGKNTSSPHLLGTGKESAFSGLHKTEVKIGKAKGSQGEAQGKALGIQLADRGTDGNE